MKMIVLIGAGEHSNVVSEIINEYKDWTIAGYVDEYCQHSEISGVTVFKTLEAVQEKYPTLDHAAIAIGNSDSRNKWADVLKSKDFKLPWFKHPTSFVSKDAAIGDGTIICAMSAVGAHARVGASVIVNTAAVIEHHAQLEDYCHISPNATVCSGALIGAHALITPAAVVNKKQVVPARTNI